MVGNDRATTTTTTTATTKIVGSSRRHFVVPSPFCCRSIHSTCVVVNERFSLHRRAAFVYEQRHFIGREDRQKPVVVRLGGNQATVRMGRRGGGIMIIIFNLKRKDERNRVKADWYAIGIKCGCGMRFDCVSLGFYSILLGLIAFYWVLPSFTGFFEEEILHGLPGFAWVFLGFT